MTMPHDTQNEDDDENEKTDNSAFLIVCEQRDRFRKKAQQLEGTKMRMQSKMSSLANANTILKDENVSLFQKIKYLENYSSVMKNRHNQQSIARNNVRMETEEKYERMYEESM